MAATNNLWPLTWLGDQALVLRAKERAERGYGAGTQRHRLMADLVHLRFSMCFETN